MSWYTQQNPHALTEELLGLKTNLSLWMRDRWMQQRSNQDWVILVERGDIIHEDILNQFGDKHTLRDGVRFQGSSEIDGADIPVLYKYTHDGTLTTRAGAWVYEFALPDGGRQEVLVTAVFYSEYQDTIVSLACVPRSFVKIWASFVNMCRKIAGPKAQEVQVVGGNHESYTPTVDWDDVILAEDLKLDILGDVKSFFSRGVEVYCRLRLNPFRKILLAGVPGTGKTMLCNALAKWSLEQRYSVIYVSSADLGNTHFYKVQQALAIAQRGKKPALILMEEIDAYLKDKQKALFLNVLDGVESFENPKGTLLVATTNYPEAIDERVLKRPGRMDRIYIVPPVKNELIARRILQSYLGDLWQDEHEQVVHRIVGYPGAFVREMVVYAVTQMIERQEEILGVESLEDSLDKLQRQIKARDALIEQNVVTNGRGVHIGFGGRN